jgi:hypothetical protein
VNDPGIFVAGVVVCLIVAAATAVLVWGLRMEARRNRSRPPERPNGVGTPLPVERQPDQARERSS